MNVSSTVILLVTCALCTRAAPTHTSLDSYQLDIDDGHNAAPTDLAKTKDAEGEEGSGYCLLCYFQGIINFFLDKSFLVQDARVGTLALLFVSQELVEFFVLMKYLLFWRGAYRPSAGLQQE